MANAAVMGGAHGLDPWLPVLARLLASEPEPVDLPSALEPLAVLGVDVPAVLRAATRHECAPEAEWHPSDWRRSYPHFPRKYALAIHVSTLQDPNVYRPFGAALHADDRDVLVLQLAGRKEWRVYGPPPVPFPEPDEQVRARRRRAVRGWLRRVQ